MAMTNFAALKEAQVKVWCRDIWRAMRDNQFTARFTGSGDDAMIQRITALTRESRGDRAVIQLVADLVRDGVTGDNPREGHEEAMQNHAQEIVIDSLSHSVISKGALSEQKTVVNFRQQAMNNLTYWLADRYDQLALLTLSGIGYHMNLDGSPRTDTAFSGLAFAGQVSPPSDKRHLRWDGSQMQAGSTAAVLPTDLPNYRMIVDAVAYAKTHYIKPLRKAGKDYYILLVQPGTLAQLKKDGDYIRAITGGAASRDGFNSPFFSGGLVTVDGAVIHEDRRVFGTQGAPVGQKWGSAGDVNGTRTLLCGAQALATVDLTAPTWVEKRFDYDNRGGICVGKQFGFLKPKFHSNFDKSVQDFGVLAIDHAQP